MSLTAGLRFTPWSIAALLDVTAAQGTEIAEALFAAGLVAALPLAGRPPRLRLTGLTHPLAAELRVQGGQDGTQESRAALTRLSRAHLRRAEESAPAAALRWIHEEHTGLREILHAAHTAGLWQEVGMLAEHLVGYYEAGALWEPWDDVSELALDAARRALDPRAEAVALCAQGSLAWQRRHFDIAASRFGLAHRRSRQAAHRPAEARALTGLADTECSRGRLKAARRLYTKATVLCRADGYPRHLCDALRGLALVDLREGDTQAALAGFLACRDTAGELGDQRWASYACRVADRIRAHDFPDDSGWEIRPGVWSLASPPPPAP